MNLFNNRLFPTQIDFRDILVSLKEIIREIGVLFEIEIFLGLDFLYLKKVSFKFDNYEQYSNRNVSLRIPLNSEGSTVSENVI